MRRPPHALHSRSNSAPGLGEEALVPAGSRVRRKAFSPGPSLPGVPPPAVHWLSGHLQRQPHTERLARYGLGENILVLHEKLSSQSQSQRNRQLRDQGDRSVPVPLCPAPLPAGSWQCDVSDHPSPAWHPAQDRAPLPLGSTWHRQLAQPPPRRPAGHPGRSCGRPPLRKAWAGRLVSVPGGWQGQLCQAPPPGQGFLRGPCEAWLCLPHVAPSSSVLRECQRESLGLLQPDHLRAGSSQHR